MDDERSEGSAWSGSEVDGDDWMEQVRGFGELEEVPDSDSDYEYRILPTLTVEAPPENPEPSDPHEQTFDPNLPMQHAYLGNDLTILHGRTLLDEDEVAHWMPLLPQIDVVLVPGQTLPLSVFHLPTIQMINRVLEGNRIFATVCMLRQNTLSDYTYADVGTTAEIYEVQEGGNNHSMRIKAIGRQRFKLLEAKEQSGGLPTARIKILPEISLSNPMAEMSFTGLNRYWSKTSNESETVKKIRKLRSNVSAISAIPSWVYDQYDVDRLVKRMLCVLSSHKAVSQIPTDPVELSFWVARSLPLPDSKRLIPLRMNCAIQRLRWELSTLEEFSHLCCRHCYQTIANHGDVFSMSAEGLQGTYCNLYGYVYETITIYKATGLQLQNVPPSTNASWFPGYAWTVAACSRCRKHMGWKFTAVEPEVKPREFWGLCRRSLTTKKVGSLKLQC